MIGDQDSTFSYNQSKKRLLSLPYVPILKSQHRTPDPSCRCYYSTGLVDGSTFPCACKVI